MQMPKFTKITTGGHPAYRFDHDGHTFEANRFASGAGAWNVDRIDGEKRTAVVRGKDTRAAAVAAVIEAPAAELVEYRVEVDRHVQARPRVFEDRYAIYQHGLADPIERYALPYRSDRSDRDTLAFRGWSILGDLEYIAGPNVFRGRVERTPVEYGNAGHWISAHLVDPSAGVPAEAGYVAAAKCGASLIATYPTPRGHALCVACTGDPVEVTDLRDRTGWLKDGGRPVKVLRALSLYDRIIASVETTDDKPREWHDVRCDATAPAILFAPEEAATRDEISAGTLVEAVVISNRPTVQQWRVDRAPWGGERDTILSDGRGVVSVWTDSLRVVEQPETERPVEADAATAERLTYDTVHAGMRVVCHSRGGLSGTVLEKYPAGFGVDRPVVRISFDGCAEAYNYPEQLSALGDSPGA